MKTFIIQMLSSGITHRISSKRVCGVIGWIVIMILIITSTIYGFQIPPLADSFLFCCMGLIGIESVTSIWRKNENKENPDSE